MNKSICIAFLLFTSYLGNSQKYCTNPEFEKEVYHYIDESVPLISCDELSYDFSNYVLLDARELKEFRTSHLPGALHIGYKNADWSILDGLNQDAKIVVYCSIGYRSEKIAEKIMEKGFNNVSNLFGSIFEWVNQDRQIVDKNENRTTLIHSYNKSWSRWIENNNLQIVF